MVIPAARTTNIELTAELEIQRPIARQRRAGRQARADIIDLNAAAICGAERDATWQDDPNRTHWLAGHMHLPPQNAAAEVREPAVDAAHASQRINRDRATLATDLRDAAEIERRFDFNLNWLGSGCSAGCSMRVTRAELALRHQRRRWQRKQNKSEVGAGHHRNSMTRM